MWWLTIVNLLKLLCEGGTAIIEPYMLWYGELGGGTDPCSHAEPLPQIALPLQRACMQSGIADLAYNSFVLASSQITNHCTQGT